MGPRAGTPAPRRPAQLDQAGRSGNGSWLLAPRSGPRRRGNANVKPSDWSADFGGKVPKEILDAINAEYDSREQSDDREERLKRVMDRFADR